MYHSIKLTIGDYFLDNPMLAIQISGIDVVLWFQGLKALGAMAMNS
jgi:hypothetical protein